MSLSTELLRHREREERAFFAPGLEAALGGALPVHSNSCDTWRSSKQGSGIPWGAEQFPHSVRRRRCNKVGSIAAACGPSLAPTWGSSWRCDARCDTLPPPVLGPCLCKWIRAHGVRLAPALLHRTQRHSAASENRWGRAVSPASVVRHCRGRVGSLYENNWPWARPPSPGAPPSPRRRSCARTNPSPGAYGCDLGLRSTHGAAYGCSIRVHGPWPGSGNVRRGPSGRIPSADADRPSPRGGCGSFHDALGTAGREWVWGDPPLPTRRRASRTAARTRRPSDLNCGRYRVANCARAAPARPCIRTGALVMGSASQ